MVAFRYILLCFFSACALWWPSAVRAGIEFSLERIDHPQVSARKLRIQLSGGGGAARISIADLRLAGKSFQKVLLDCPQTRLVAGVLDCPAGRLSAAGIPSEALAFRLDLFGRKLDLKFGSKGQEHWQLATGKKQNLALILEQARLERLSWLPGLAGWNPKGAASGSLNWDGTARKLNLALDLSGLSFGDASGSHAGEKIGGRLEADLSGSSTGWNWRVLVDWKEGEGYSAPWYFEKAGLRLAASGALEGDLLTVAQLDSTQTGIGTVTGSAEVDLAGKTLRRFDLQGQDLDMAVAGKLLIAPAMEQAGLPKPALAGRLNLKADWRDGGFKSLDVGLHGASVSVASFTLDGIEASLPWRIDGPGAGHLSVAGGSLGKLPLGAFSTKVGLNGWAVDLPRLEIPVLDGAIAFDAVRVERRNGQWNGAVGVSVHPIAMPRLTVALGLPRMEGTLTASIPRLSLHDNRIDMDGTLIIQVFDGYLAANELSLADPFGRAPILQVRDMQMRRLDLGQLTKTFSFGDISGFLDGDVTGLELARWQPQRFDARFQSSEGSYRKRISQRAVENISALGGAGAGAAIQRSFLSIFESFGYERIGLSCRLLNGVCRMGGVGETAQGFLIVKGGGVPAINVIGYNRSIDWEELLSRLKRVLQNNAKPVIQ